MHRNYLGQSALQHTEQISEHLLFKIHVKATNHNKNSFVFWKTFQSRQTSPQNSYVGDLLQLV